MDNIIKLLPEFVANQIAAGEVINRPSAVVKELVENSLDAKARNIELYIQDAGKNLIQVIDDGNGMEKEDAQQCFLRHATSKISKAEDLHTLYTMGFRGEALAAISAIAQVELKTRTENSQTGTLVRIEGEGIKECTECICEKGCSIAVKNIYFNTPARRQFLKTDDVEFKHIEEEFIRLALANCNIGFSLIKNGKQLYKLSASNLHTRILDIFGTSFEKHLVRVGESMNELNIEGFICKPDFTNKSRHKQYLFVNKRHIKHIGLNHAIETAYRELIANKTHPIYILFIDIDPKEIDVNIHPTKAEIRFIDERLIYKVLFSTVKHSIGLNQLAPALDFDNKNNFEINPPPTNYFPKQPQLDLKPDYNPFLPIKNSNTGYSSYKSDSIIDSFQKGSDFYKNKYLNLFENFFGDTNTIVNPCTAVQSEADLKISEDKNGDNSEKIFQIKDSYIVTSIKSGIIIIDQQAASERILFQQYANADDKQVMRVQKILFPQTISFSASNADTLNDISSDLSSFGWEIEWIGDTSFIVNATPSNAQNHDIQQLLDDIIHDYIQNIMCIKGSRDENISSAMAKRLSIKKGKKLKNEEMAYIVSQLFSCTYNNMSPSGKKIYFHIKTEEIENNFK